MEKILDKSFFPEVIKDKKLSIAMKGGMLLAGGLLKGL